MCLFFFFRFVDTLEQADDMAIDIPHIWLYLAELLSPMLREGGFSMRELFRYWEICSWVIHLTLRLATKMAPCCQSYLDCSTSWTFQTALFTNPIIKKVTQSPLEQIFLVYMIFLFCSFPKWINVRVYIEKSSEQRWKVFRNEAVISENSHLSRSDVA